MRVGFPADAGIASPADPDRIGDTVAAQMRKRYPASARATERDAIVLIDRVDTDWERPPAGG